MPDDTLEPTQAPHWIMQDDSPEDEAQEMAVARWLMRTVQEMKQRGAWDRGKEQDS